MVQEKLKLQDYLQEMFDLNLNGTDVFKINIVNWYVNGPVQTKFLAETNTVLFIWLRKGIKISKLSDKLRFALKQKDS